MTGRRQLWRKGAGYQRPGRADQGGQRLRRGHRHRPAGDDEVRLRRADKKYGIKTIVSMNPIMIDGTGMCGGCRLTVGGKTKFACVDGPDFDGHQVDFDEAMEAGHHVPGVRGPCPRENLQSVQKGGARWNAQYVPEEKPDAFAGARMRNKNFEEVALGYTKEKAWMRPTAACTARTSPCSGCPWPSISRVHRAESRKRILRAPIRCSSPAQRAARGLRPGLPPGEPVRGQMRAGHQGRTVGHRPSGALCRRLANAHTPGRPRKPPRPNGPQGRHHRARARRA